IMQLLNLLNKRFGISMGVEEMLYNATIRKLAERIDGLCLAGGADQYSPIPRLKDAEHFELSHAQKRFWVLNQLEGKEAYNVPLGFSFRGEIEIDLLEKALRALIGRHESLRTSFLLVDGQPRQKIADAATLGPILRCQDLTEWKDTDAAAAGIIKKEAGTPFDLRTGPLIRAVLLRTGRDRFLRCINLHHIVADARSIAIIKQEIMVHYQALKGGGCASLPSLPIQYKDFAAWQNNLLSADTIERYRTYWEGRLGKRAHMVNLPVDFRLSAGASAEAERIVFPIGETYTAQLRKLAERNSTTVFMVT